MFKSIGKKGSDKTMLKVYQREYKRRPIPKDHKGLYSGLPYIHGEQTKIEENNE